MAVTVLINRSRARPAPGDVYIGRPSQFQNPFVVGVDGTRAEVLARYKKYFHERISTDEAFRQAIVNLRGKRLACWCKPLPCHGDVIVAWLEGCDG